MQAIRSGLLKLVSRSRKSLIVAATLLPVFFPSAAASGVLEIEGPVLGEFPRSDSAPCLTDEERREILDKLSDQVSSLLSKGVLDPPTLTSVPFGWPLAPWNGLSDYGYHGTSNFVDQDPAFPNSLRDYQCGTRTYDTSLGYNHAGTDFFTSPFGWLKMDTDQVAVVAAAAGTILGKVDGNFDRSCTLGGGTWNAVYVRHADGSVAWYGHLKKNSTTSKSVGEAVSAGEYLGIVGSSGSSTGPHLHFEVYDAGNNLIDPYSGPCNSLNPTSWWISQRPYYDSAVNKVMTGGAAVVFPACPNQENPNARTQFSVGDRIYFTTFYRDQLQGQVSQYSIYAPSGSLEARWTHSISVPHYAWSYWYWVFVFNPPIEEGTWRFEVVYQGNAYETFFNVGPPSPSGRLPESAAVGPLLAVTAEPNGDLTFTWGDSCSAGDIDFEVYEGRLGSYASHAPVLCSTGGLQTATITPAAGSSYYLVVPRTAFREGSYGRDSNQLERPQSASACLPQSVATCP